MDAELLRIARRVRRWRERGGLTLQELAARSGLAPSTVQKVETAQMIPSLAVLLKLARGLRRRPAELVQDVGDEPERLLSRAADRRTFGVRNRMRVERISGDLADADLDQWRLTLHPGVSSGRDTIQFDGEEIVLCEAGRVTVEIDGEDVELSPGDALQFKATLPHRWRNDGDEPARLLLTATLSAHLRAALQGRRGERHSA